MTTRKRLILEIEGIVLAALSVLAAVAVACAVGEFVRPRAAAASALAKEKLEIPPPGTQERLGYTLFMANCAHCHGDDARGDEGPDLHGLTKSNARISSTIKNGI